ARIREGYTVARIEGNASPEGPEQPRPGGRFEGNVALAQRRADKAHADLQAALRKALTGLGFRGTGNLRAALTATYPVEGHGELFGRAKGAEVPENQLLRHLLAELPAPAKGERDLLAEAHVTGEGLPPEVAAEVEAQVAEFREGRRGEKRLKEA